MTNELAVVGNNPIDINKAFGMEDERLKPLIPQLKINGEAEEEGRGPKGNFTYNNGERFLYAEEVTIRSFVKGYQYRSYDATDKTKNDSSTIEKSFKGEFRSLSGRLACGKLSKKRFEALGDTASAMQVALQKNVKCKLLVFGLISGKFTNIDDKKQVELKDELFYWAVSQSGFMDMDQTIKGILQERRAVALTPIKLKLKKEKNGAVTYFVPVPEVLNETAVLDVARDGGYLEKIKEFVKGTNDFINTKYNAAVKGKQENENFANAGGLVDDDINDL